MAYNYHQTGQGIVIGHWSLVISKEAEAEKRRKETGDVRQETVRTTKIIRSKYHYGIKNIALDFGFVIWNLLF